MNQTIISLGKKIVPHLIRIFFRKLNWKRMYLMQTLFHKSSQKKVYCPIAKKEFKSFIKFGDQLLSPSNGARNRQRLVWHYLENKLNIFENEFKMLHTAPELSFYKILKKAKNIEYVPGDKMVDGYSNQQGIENIDLTNLQFDDYTFDLIVSNHVLEHIPDDRKAMSEIFRVLKNGGSAVITVPINENLSQTYEDPAIVLPKERENHFGQWDHVRFYSLDIKDRLEETGLKVEMIRYGDQFSKEDFEKFGFTNDLIIIGKKFPLTV